MIKFFKFQATGNDFILLKEGDFSVPFYSLLCNRHFGVGADGIIIPRKRNNMFYMEYRNSDGNVSSFCGNGSRAFILFLKKYLNVEQNSFLFLAYDGIHKANVINDNLVEVSLKIRETTFKVFSDTEYFIDSGSPHYVKFIESDVDEFSNFVEYSRRIRYSEQFPEGTNVNIVSIAGDNIIKVRTYERGVEAETLSCGTGTVATAYVYNKLSGDKYKNIVVKTRGGELQVSFDKGNIYLLGPVYEVFQGELNLDYFNEKLKGYGLHIREV